MGLYASVVLVIGKFVREFFSGISHSIMFEELPCVDRILKLCTDIFLVSKNLIDAVIYHYLCCMRHIASYVSGERDWGAGVRGGALRQTHLSLSLSRDSHQMDPPLKDFLYCEELLSTLAL